MSDAQFTPEYVPQRYGDRVQRAAVLYPMFGKLTTKDEIIDATLKMQRVWRKSLQNLLTHGWIPGGGSDPEKALQYARNCLPTFVCGRPRTKCCRLDHICPFCYARRVRDVWESLDLAFPNPRSPIPPTWQVRMNEDPARQSRTLELATPHSEQRPAGEFPYWLIERRNEVNIPFLEDPIYRDLLVFLPNVRTQEERTPDTKIKLPDISKKARRERFAKAAEVRLQDWPKFAGHLRATLEDIIERRRKLQVLKPLGMFAMTVIEPLDYGWHIEHRQLFMVPAGTTYDQELKFTRGRLVTHTTPDRETIFKAVIRTCAYPPKLLFRDPELLALLLRTRKGFRLSSTTGRFRNQADLEELRRRRRS